MLFTQPAHDGSVAEQPGGLALSGSDVQKGGRLLHAGRRGVCLGIHTCARTHMHVRTHDPRGLYLRMRFPSFFF